MPDTPEPGLVDLDLIDPETTADLQLAAARRPDPSHVREFVDVGLSAEDVPSTPLAECCPSCGQAVPPIRALLDDTMSHIGTRSAVVLTDARRRAVTARPALAALFRGADPADLDAETLNVITALTQHFDPGSPEAMALLDAELDPLAAVPPAEIPDMDWPGGRRPPLLLDHAVLTGCLIAALRIGDEAWTPLHTRAWHTALSYSAARMCAAQVLGGAR